MTVWVGIGACVQHLFFQVFLNNFSQFFQLRDWQLDALQPLDPNARWIKSSSWGAKGKDETILNQQQVRYETLQKQSNRMSSAVLYIHICLICLIYLLFDILCLSGSWLITNYESRSQWRTFFDVVDHGRAAPPSFLAADGKYSFTPSTAKLMIR